MFAWLLAGPEAAEEYDTKTQRLKDSQSVRSNVGELGQAWPVNAVARLKMSHKRLAAQLFQAVLQGNIDELQRLLDCSGAASAINIPAPATPLVAAVCRCELKAGKFVAQKSQSRFVL